MADEPMYFDILCGICDNDVFQWDGTKYVCTECGNETTDRCDEKEKKDEN